MFIAFFQKKNCYFEYLLYGEHIIIQEASFFIELLLTLFLLVSLAGGRLLVWLVRRYHRGFRQAAG